MLLLFTNKIRIGSGLEPNWIGKAFFANRVKSVISRDITIFLIRIASGFKPDWIRKKR